MRIRKVHIDNFKVYEGYNDIDCTINTNVQKPLIIIGGPNGAGKTSFLEALKLCLFGNHNKSLLSPYSGNYQRYLREVHNKTAKLDNKPFSITLEYSDDRIRDIDIFSIKRTWRLNKENNYYENLELFANGALRDDIDPSDFQLEINEHFPIGVSELLFFDSEEFNRIPEFLENGFISSLNKFMGIDVYNQLNEDLLKVKKKQISASDSQLSLDMEDNEQKLSNLKEQQKDLETEKTSVQQQKRELSSQIDQLTITLQKESGDISLTNKELDNEALLITQKSKLAGEENRKVYSEIVPFSLAEKLCDSLIKSLKSENDHKEQKIVQKKIKDIEKSFLEKANEKVDSKTFNTLGEIWREVNVSNVKRKKLVHDISSSKMIEITKKLSEIKKTSKKEIERVKSQIKRVKTDQFNLVKKRRKFNPEGPGSATYDDLKNLTMNLGQLVEREDKIVQKLNDLEKLLNAQEIQLKIIFNKHEKSTKRTKKSEMIDKSLTLLEHLSTALTESRFTKLKKNFIETYKALSTKSDKISELNFNQNEKKLEFLDHNGIKLGMKDFSAGESEVATFCLLWAVNETAETRYPIVTDSPFNRLDTNHRNNFIEKILKKSKSQIIFLSTNEEISNIDNFGLRDFIQSTYIIKHSPEKRSSKFISDYF